MKNKSRFEKGFDPGTKPRIGQANKGEKCKPFFFFKEKTKQNKKLPPTDSIASGSHSNFRPKLKYLFIQGFLQVRHY